MKLININVTCITIAVASLLAEASSANMDNNDNLCWSGNENPATNPDVPFFNSNLSVDCTGLNDHSSLQCGRDYYGKEDKSFLNWVYSAKHSGFPSQLDRNE